MGSVHPFYTKKSYIKLRYDDSIGSINATEKKNDNVESPKHYTSHPSGVECIEIAKHHNFCTGSAIKYIWRCGIKNQDTEIEDLEKAVRFLNFEIKRLKAKENDKNN